ncbi:SPT3 Dosage dependent suppressor of Ty-induced promoter mutations-like protein [Umbelopsis sp. WA50703]
MVGSTRALKAIPKDALERLWTGKETRLTLRHLYALGKHVDKAQNMNAKPFRIPTEFLCSELPIRYGHMLSLLHAHPQARSSPSITRVIDRYFQDAHKLTSLSIPGCEDEAQEFTHTLRTLRRRQCGSLLRLRHGLLTENLGNEAAQKPLHTFLDQCNGLGVGVNLLIGEHLCLNDKGHNLVQLINPTQVAESAILEARKYCADIHQVSPPQVQLVCKDDNLSTTYVPAHLHRVLFELLTNSLTATIKHGENTPVRLTLVKGEEDVTIRLSDRGGGICAREVHKAWRYHINPKHDALMEHDEDDAQVEMDVKRGLRFARLLARYFGGDLALISMEGYGTDTFLALSRDDAVTENYPLTQPMTSSFLKEAFI